MAFCRPSAACGCEVGGSNHTRRDKPLICHMGIAWYMYVTSFRPPFSSLEGDKRGSISKAVVEAMHPIEGLQVCKTQFLEDVF